MKGILFFCYKEIVYALEFIGCSGGGLCSRSRR